MAALLNLELTIQILSVYIQTVKKESTFQMVVL